MSKITELMTSFSRLLLNSTVLKNMAGGEGKGLLFKKSPGQKTRQ